jgi:coupling of ubiquitin conjugation to ER degradation protein 1
MDKGTSGGLTCVMCVQAPPSFQPPPQFLAAVSSNLPTPAQATKSLPPDLITRYNLQARVNGKGKEREDEDVTATTGWQTDKEKRAAMLKKRRDDMILAARQRMEEKDREAGPAAS